MNTQQKYYQDNPQENPKNQTIMKTGRLTTTARKAKKLQAFNLFNEGKTPKEIVKKTGISYKTVLGWLKPWKEETEAQAETLHLCNQRLQTLLKDPNAKTSDIKNLVSALEALKKAT